MMPAMELEHLNAEGVGFAKASRSGEQFANVTKEARKPIEWKEDAKDKNSLELSIPEDYKVWNMKVKIEDAWKIPMEDQVLTDEKGNVLDDEMIIKSDMKVKLKFTEYA